MAEAVVLTAHIEAVLKIHLPFQRTASLDKKGNASSPENTTRPCVLGWKAVGSCGVAVRDIYCSSEST